MKKLVLFLLFFTSTVCYATLHFETDKTYRIQCKMWNNGVLLTGRSHGSNIPLYYDLVNTTSEDAYWYIREEEDGKFSFKNAFTKQYMTYDGERTNDKRYVDLTDDIQGDASLWNIVEQPNGYLIICCQNGHYLDVRTSSYIVGTYEQYGSPGQNELFDFLETGAVSESINTYVDTLYINGKQAIYNATDDAYLFPLSKDYIESNQFIGNIKVCYKNNQNLQLDIDGEENSGTFTFQNFSEGNSFELKLKDEEGLVVAQSKLSFTFMPIVEISGYGFNNYSYTNGTIKVNDPNTTIIDTIAQAKFRYRGATASTKNKKAYAVKLIDQNQESMDASYFGLRSDNNWILDAMAIDPGRMRNRISTDLWNDYATLPYHFTQEPEAHNGTRGLFVELFLNGEYAGIYCMTEKLDRKQLKLKKQQFDSDNQTQTIRGLLYKSSQWSYSVLMGHNLGENYYPGTTVAAYNNNSDTWDGWEMQYPDLEDGEIIDWAPLADAINKVAATDDTEFQKEVYTYFDIPVFLDYYLFIELILATDNHGKNLFLHNYNIQESPKLSISPWDLDGTWGRRWDGSNNITSDASQDFVTFLWNNEHGELTLFKRLAELNIGNWNEKLAARYATLRQNYFNPENLIKRFAETFNLFKKSGADQREISRWNGSDGIQLNFEEELEYLSQWIDERIKTLDNQYAYDPTTRINETKHTTKLTVSGGIKQIILRSNECQNVYIYNINGTLIMQKKILEGITVVPMMNPGIYLVNDQKIYVR